MSKAGRPATKGDHISMLKALTAVALVAGIALAIVGAVGGGIAFTIVGDVLVVVGVVQFLIARRGGLPTSGLPG